MQRVAQAILPVNRCASSDGTWFHCFDLELKSKPASNAGFTRAARPEARLRVLRNVLYCLMRRHPRENKRSATAARVRCRGCALYSGETRMKVPSYKALGAVLVLTVAGVAVAQGPVVNIGGKHPNLRDAQQHIVAAYGKIEAAQHDPHESLGGHGERAKQLLTEADAEIRAAATDANITHH
jgi:hypothetical protein